jgi:hypothetical protein
VTSTAGGVLGEMKLPQDLFRGVKARLIHQFRWRMHGLLKQVYAQKLHASNMLLLLCSEARSR